MEELHHILKKKKKTDVLQQRSEMEECEKISEMSQSGFQVRRRRVALTGLCRYDYLHR